MILGALLTTSCSNDEPSTPSTGDGTVTFRANIADVPRTRDYADGKSAVNLYCIVYDDADNYQMTKQATFNNLTAEVELQLLKDKTYNIIFFAARDLHEKTNAWDEEINSVYAFDTKTKTITIDYSKMNAHGADGACIDDDCFYEIRRNFLAGTDQGGSVTLHRPVAQINFGSNDLAAPIVETTYPNGIYSKISLQAYNTFNLLTGAAEGDAQTVTLPLTNYNTGMQEEVFPVTGYNYMAMGYVLVPEEGTVSDVTLDVYNGSSATIPEKSVNVSSAPLKRNNRTNIYGSLLTASSQWDIIVNPDWDGSFNVSDYTNDAALAAGGAVKVNTPVNAIAIPQQLDAPLTLNLNAAVGTLSIGEISQPVTINVAKDVDYPQISFENGATVKGLTINGDPTSTKNLSGFNFQNDKSIVRPGMLEDLTFDGVTFEGYGFEPQYSCSTLNTVIRNCRFINMQDAAVATQQSGAGTNFTCENFTVENCVIEMNPDVTIARNGIYLADVTGSVTVANNTIRNAAYHGIFVFGIANDPGTNVTINGNTIADAKEDGIKVQRIKGSITADSNNISGCKGNGIRLKDCVWTADVNICDNSINMSAAPWNESAGEPYAILLANSSENEGAKVIVNGNTILNSNGHNFGANNIVYAAGSNVDTPFNN